MNRPKFTLSFATDNSVFDDDHPEDEAERILIGLARRVADGSRGGTVYDFNGNSIGEFSFETVKDG